MKSESKFVKRELNDIQARALADFHYAYFCVSCACRILSSDKRVKSAFTGLDEVLNNFFLAVGTVEKEEK